MDMAITTMQEKWYIDISVGNKCKKSAKKSICPNCPN